MELATGTQRICKVCKALVLWTGSGWVDVAHGYEVCCYTGEPESLLAASIKVTARLHVPMVELDDYTNGLLGVLRQLQELA